MLVGNKLFSYPVLNNDKKRTSYTNKKFELKYTTNEGDEVFVLENVSVETDSKFIKKLYSEGKIGIVCVVECSQTFFRECYEINFEGGVSIPLIKNNLTDRVVISAFAYAREKIILDSEEFIDEYKGIKYEIDKHSIVCAHDGQTYYFRKEEIENDSVKSIFSIIVDHKLKSSDGYDIDINGPKITISLNDEAFDNYKCIHSVSSYKDLFFSMILVHALEIALIEAQKVFIQNSLQDFDDLSNKWKWFPTILVAYKMQYGDDLEEQEFLQMKEEELVRIAQKLLGNPINNSLMTLTNNFKMEDEEDE